MYMLQSAKEYMGQLFSNKKFLVVLVVVALFICLALYVYTTYVAPRLQPSFVPNREFVPEEAAVKKASLYFFFVDWCPYCKKAQPVWDKMKKKYDQKAIKGITMDFISVNGDTQEAEVSAFEKEYSVKIDGFPTIYLVKGSQVIEYDAKPEAKTMTEFLNTAV